MGEAADKGWQPVVQAGAALQTKRAVARDDYSMEYLQAIGKVSPNLLCKALKSMLAAGSFVVVTELPQAARMGDVWYTCTCGDAEHDALCVHILSAGLQNHPHEFARLMPAKARHNVSLQDKPKGGRPPKVAPVRSFWG